MLKWKCEAASLLFSDGNGRLDNESVSNSESFQQLQTD